MKIGSNRLLPLTSILSPGREEVTKVPSNLQGRAMERGNHESIF
jgi:hypothetical protein